MNLLLVVAFYKGDKGQALRLGKWINLLSGGNKVGDKVLLVSSYDTTVDAEMTTEWAKSFNEVKGIRLKIGPPIEYGENPWPKAPNHQFLSVMQYISESRTDCDAFYYLEPDNLPIEANWLERIKEEYAKCGMPFMGARSKWIKGEHKGIEGHHMIGTGIYPQDAWIKFPCFEAMQAKMPNVPWDAHLAAQTNPNCYFTDLIAHQHQARGYRYDGTCMAPVKGKDRTIIQRVKAGGMFENKDAIVVHGTKDASLRDIVAVTKGIKWPDTLVFRHGGDLGDAIYGLASIKDKVGEGKGILYLAEKGGGREPFTPARMAALSSLVNDQAYVEVQPDKPGEYVDYDFTYLRSSHVSGDNLAKCHAEWVGADPHCFDKPWLTVSGVKETQQVIVNRTKRYRNELFPWKKVVRESGRNGFFIGLPDEHQDFEDTFGSISFLPTSGLIDAARLIAGSRLFVGNQSACFAIAEGLKHPRIQETFPEAADCVFDSSSGTYVSDGELYWPDAQTQSPEPPIERPRLVVSSTFKDAEPFKKVASLGDQILAECKRNPSFVHRLKRILANPPKRTYQKRNHAEAK